MKKPADLSQIDILIKADTNIAINQVQKLTYSVHQLNVELKEMAKLQGLLKNTGFLKKALLLLKKKR